MQQICSRSSHHAGTGIAVASMLCLLLAGALTLLCLGGCTQNGSGNTGNAGNTGGTMNKSTDGIYKIDYNGMEFCYEDPVTSAKAGQTIRAHFCLFATDTDYHFDVQGVDNWTYDGSDPITIVFTMPENDVSIKVSSRNSMVDPAFAE